MKTPINPPHPPQLTEIPNENDPVHGASHGDTDPEREGSLLTGLSLERRNPDIVLRKDPDRRGESPDQVLVIAGQNQKIADLGHVIAKVRDQEAGPGTDDAEHCKEQVLINTI